MSNSVSMVPAHVPPYPPRPRYSMAVIQSLTTPSHTSAERASESRFLRPTRRPRPQMTLQTQVDAPYPRAQSPAGEQLMGNSTTTSRPGFLGFFGRSFSSGKTAKRNVSLPDSQNEDVPAADMPHTENETTPFIPKRSLTEDHTPYKDSRPSLTNRRPSRTLVTLKSNGPQSDAIMSPWDPPPLFEAYPQAIKHAYLPVPTLPIEEILRRHQYECYSRSKQEICTGSATLSIINDDAPPSSEQARLEQALFISKSEWTHKIFVLVKSGHLLQYAAKGSYDRRPEKVLPLETHSAVFASDAIPGKHWVLQVSQRSDAGDFGATDTTGSLFRKLSLKGSPTRKPVGNLLLILYSADEMECWMSAIRKQIEDFGGNPAATEARVREKIAEVHGFSGRPSIDSSLTQLDSERSSSVNGLGLYSPGVCGPGRYDKPPRSGCENHTPEPVDPRSFFRPPSDAGSVSTGMHSDDQTQLDRLREDFDVSSTSRGTSLASTPIREDFSKLGVRGHCKQLSMDSYTSNMVRSESADSRRIIVDDRASLDHPRPPFLSSRSRSNSDRTVYTSMGLRSSPGLRSKYVPTCPSPLSPIPPNILSGSPPQGGWPTGHGKSSSISSTASTCVTGYFDVSDPSDPTAEITASIYDLLNSSPPMDIITDIRHRRSSSVQRRPRRAGANVRPRASSSSTIRSASASPPMGYEIDALAAYRPKPLRIKKRTFSSTSSSSVASGPPPGPPPACPLPAVPPEAASPNLWTGDHRAAELRKQSWKVMRAYHPLRVDVV